MKNRYAVLLTLLGLYGLVGPALQAQPNTIAIRGLESQNEGTAAWNANGSGPEPAATGHAVTWTGCVAHAYHYLASRDFVDPGASYAVQGIGLTGFSNFGAALTAGNYAIGDFTIAHGLLSLGDDVEGEDWIYDATTHVETRFYTGTATMDMRLGGEPMATAPLIHLTVIIAYNSLSNCFDDQVFGFSDYALPIDASGGSSPAVQQAAAAFIQDVGLNGIRFDFDSIQPAAQLDFSAQGRSGAFFDAQGEQQVGSTPLPVELKAFDALVDGAAVRLSWETVSETNNAGFAVMQRQPGVTGWQSLAFVDGQGTTEMAQTYSHQIQHLQPGTYRFRLKQVDYDGTFDYSPEVEVAIGVPGDYLLTEAYPNPFNPQTAFSLSVARQQQVRVVVYDGLGRQVAVLLDERMASGQARSLVFEAGSLPSGLYVIRAVGERFVATRRVMLVK